MTIELIESGNTVTWESQKDILNDNFSELAPFANVATMVTTELVVGVIYETQGYYDAGGLGADSYLIQTLAEFGSTPDGVVNFAVNGGADVAVLMISNDTTVDSAGARANGTIDDSVSVQAMADYLITLTSEFSSPQGYETVNKIAVLFTPGKKYLIGTEIALPTAGHLLDWGCIGGTASIVSTGNTNGFIVAERLWQNQFFNLSFSGFDTVLTFETGNVDQALISFSECSWVDCTRGVDTTSFALSRSTEVVFNRCRSAYTPRLIDSYCDKLSLVDCVMRNGSDTQSFILADSLVSVRGGGFVPFNTGAGSRWIDLYNSDTSNTRGFVSVGVRWSKEGGGIPVIYNYIDTGEAGLDKQVNNIVFNGGIAGSSGALTPEGVVVLTESSGRSLAPDNICFYGVAWSASNGLVVTESGSPVSDSIVGSFTIYADEPTQSRLATSLQIPNVPLMEDQLVKFQVGSKVYDTRSESGTGSYELVAETAPKVRMTVGAGATITSISHEVMDGHRLSFIFISGVTTIIDVAQGGNVHFVGNADYVSTANDTLVLEWNRSNSLWYEISRSAN